MWNFHKVKIYGKVCVFEIARMHSFTFSKDFSNQSKIGNENAENIFFNNANLHFANRNLHKYTKKPYKYNTTR